MSWNNFSWANLFINPFLEFGNEDTERDICFGIAGFVPKWISEGRMSLHNPNNDDYNGQRAYHEQVNNGWIADDAYGR